MADPAKFDPASWLEQEYLRINDIFALLRGKNPTDSRGPSKDQDPQLQALKAAIDAGELVATREKDGFAYLRTAIKFSNAIAFIEAHKSDPGWKWFYEFCRRWAASRGVDLAGSNTPPTIAGKTKTREWLVKLMRDGSKIQPKAEYRQSAMKEFEVSRRGFDSAWAKAIEDTGAHNWAKPGPVNS